LGARASGCPGTRLRAPWPARAAPQNRVLSGRLEGGATDSCAHVRRLLCSVPGLQVRSSRLGRAQWPRRQSAPLVPERYQGGGQALQAPLTTGAGSPSGSAVRDRFKARFVLNRPCHGGPGPGLRPCHCGSLRWCRSQDLFGAARARALATRGATQDTYPSACETRGSLTSPAGSTGQAGDLRSRRGERGAPGGSTARCRAMARHSSQDWLARRRWTMAAFPSSPASAPNINPPLGCPCADLLDDTHPAGVPVWVP
jgi:hypothetical protein